MSPLTLPSLGFKQPLGFAAAAAVIYPFEKSLFKSQWTREIRAKINTIYQSPSFFFFFAFIFICF